MFRYITALLLTGIIFSAYTQDLIHSRQSSYYTFIYKITDDESNEIYTDDYPSFKESYFHTLVDFYPTDSIAYKKSLPVGHYLTVKSIEERLEFTIQSVDNIHMNLLNNHRDMMMVFSDSVGNEIIKDIQVKIKGKAIPYSNKHQAFVLEKSNRKGLVQVNYNGHSSFFTIERKHNNGFFIRSSKTILSTFPINHIISPVTYSIQNVKNIIHGNRIYPPGLYYRTKRLFDYQSKKTSGYMAFNKPMYKPGDTVKLKAYVTTLKGKPISRKKTTINLSHYTSTYQSKNLGYTSSPNKGSYVFEFILHDSLKLSLDQSLSLYLKNQSGKNLMQGSVRYEDYELKQNTYTIRSQVDQPDQAPVIYLKGTDSNDLPLFDVGATILITPKNINDYFQQNVFVPDTLWSHTLKLDPLGETKVIVPDSIFPSISFEYQVQACFRNAENELTIKELSLKYNPKAFPAKLKLSNDSLSISWNAGSESDELVSVTAVNDEDTLSHQQVSLALHQPIIPLANYYIITYKDQIKEFDLSEFQSLVSPISHRTSDSLFVTIDNPRNLMIRYQLFKGNNLIDKSSGTVIDLARKANSSATYSFAMQYIWGGKSIENNYTITLNTRELDIHVEHPKEIYPGQEAEFTVSVKDYKNNPVAHTDLTAYAVTKKFTSSSAVSVPSFFKPKPGRKIFNEFNEQQPPQIHNRLMDFPFWRKEIGLDSITFYKFLYPDDGYFIHYSPTDENLTQFAPFVIRKGIILPINVIYVDNVVVYYNRASVLQPYSFPMSPGKHTIRLRLANKEIILHNITAVGGEKLILSIDPEREIPFGEAIKKPTKFTKTELNNLQRYFVFAKHNQYAQSYMSQANRFYRLNTSRDSELIGPFNPGTVNFVAQDYNHSFYYESNYAYTFDKELIKMKDINIRKSLTNRYYYNNNKPSLSSQLLTRCRVEDAWKALEVKRTIQFDKYVNGPMTKTGRLLIAENNSSTGRLLQGIYALNLDNPDQYFLFPNKYNLSNEIQYGHYQIVLIYDNYEYISSDSMVIKPHGLNYYNFKDYPVHAPDSFSTKILSTIEQWENNSSYSEYTRSREAQVIRGLYYDKEKDKNPYSHLVSGKLIEKYGDPIPGANVLVKGTTFGTSTDINGYYEIRCPDDATLIFSFIGYKTEERRVNATDQINVILQEDVSHLQEVVVVGYGVQRKQSLTYSVSTVESSLMGRMAGVTAVPGIRVRGASSIEGRGTPLYIVDGVVVNLDTIDPNSITAMQVLNETSATAIYGSRAANGAIIISTRPGMTDEKLLETLPQMPSIIPLDGNIPGSSLRNNFRDYGFWKPVLYTDENGKATFKASFPDDITGWNIYVLGMADKKRSGQAQSQIQSYKPLIAQLALPHFLIAGDSSYAVGKLTNYSKDTIEVENDLTINEQLQYSRNIKFLNSQIDSILLNGSDSDSIKVTYKINYNGYQDGEQRTIPVKPQGTEETIGMFIALPTDTSFVVNFSDSLGTVKLNAQADLLDVLYDEINYLKYYAYECNEQLASKLRALLAKKKMDEFRDEKFESEKEVHKIIKKLVNNQNQQGGWGWWNQSESNLWTTIHVGEALELARNSNIEFIYDRELMIQNLFSLFIESGTTDRLRCMIFLTQLGEKIDAKTEIDALLQDKKITHYNKLLAQRLLSLSGMAPDYDWISLNKHETLKGNYYWGEEINHLLNNDVTNTILAYSILEKRNPNDPELIRIRNYFLEKRKKHWRNTYESSLIVETILPGLIKNKNKETKPSLSIRGNGIDKTITTFPFEMELAKITPLTINKQGTSPIYFTAYQEIWNPSPSRVDKDFGVSTSFENHSNELEAGKTVTLNVDVTVKKDAEYVMIQIPIPAGCSYESKIKGYGQGEVHREHYLHQTNIYAQSLKQGKYTYTIKLVPRYKGTYHLNPATIEWMYFPTVFGREAMKKIKIK